MMMTMMPMSIPKQTNIIYLSKINSLKVKTSITAHISNEIDTIMMMMMIMMIE
jgi:hypothetical protein